MTDSSLMRYYAHLLSDKTTYELTSPFRHVLPQVYFMEQRTSTANETILSRIDITKMLE